MTAPKPADLRIFSEHDATALRGSHEDLFVKKPFLEAVEALSHTHILYLVLRLM